MTAPTLGLAEAAIACGVSESPLRRRREELQKLGAKRDANGMKGWRIPVPALVQLGLMSKTTAASAETHESSPDMAVRPFTTPPNDAAQIEIEGLKKALVDANTRAAVAEAIAQERERIIQVQEQALRMLEAAPARAVPISSAEAARPTLKPRWFWRR